MAPSALGNGNWQGMDYSLGIPHGTPMKKAFSKESNRRIVPLGFHVEAPEGMQCASCSALRGLYSNAKQQWLALMDAQPQPW